jgi:hypothetical protein
MAVRNCPDASIGIGGRFPDFWRFYLRGVAGAEREDPAQQVQGCKRSALPVIRFEAIYCFFSPF